MAIRVRRPSRIAGLATVALTLGVGAADARPVTLWACHGPQGRPLGPASLTPGQTGDGLASVAGEGCDGPGGLLATFSRPDPLGGSSAAWRADVPAGTSLQRVVLTRTTTPAAGPFAGGTQRAVVRAGATVLESTDLGAAGPSGVLDLPVFASSVTVAAVCDAVAPAACGATSPGALEVSALALHVDDAVAPRGSVGGVSSPAWERLDLAVNASDEGAGLAEAVALVDGVARGTAVLSPGCGELDAGTATPDVALGGCAADVQRAALTVDLAGVSAGSHLLRVVARDAAGNEAVLHEGEFAVAAPAPPQASVVQLSVGDPNRGGGAGSTGGGATTPPGAADAGAPAPACNHPRLAMALDQKPLRVRAGRPVLQRAKRYRFRGRLTCRVGRARRSAPRGVVVDVVSRTARRTVGHTGMATRRGGHVTVILAPRSSRTLVFRHRAATGTSQVRIPISVVAVKTKTTSRKQRRR